MALRRGPKRLPQVASPFLGPLCSASSRRGSALSAPSLLLLEAECYFSYGDPPLHRQLIWIERGRPHSNPRARVLDGR